MSSSSSSSSSDSELLEVPPRVDSLLPNRRSVYEDVRSDRKHPAGNEHSRIQTNLPGHRPTASSTASSSRLTNPTQNEPLRYNPAPFPTSDMSTEARRQSIMAMDRKRRFTESSQENSGGGRRRNLAGGFNERDDIFHSRSADTVPSASRPQTTYQRQRHGPGLSAEVIDLTNSPPHMSGPSSSLTPRSSGSTYVLPRWQPDSEVTECPICHRPFTLWFRRHHCRKCGRVVCNDCSPHRITIPRQFIVNQPGTSMHTGSGGRDTVDLTGDDDHDEQQNEQHIAHSTNPRHHRHIQNTSIGGGEKVRLCNPCVPDPQPEPQPNYNSNPLPPLQSAGRRDGLLSLSDVLRTSRHSYQNNRFAEPFPGLIPQHPPQNPLPYTMHHSSRTRPLPLSPHHPSEGSSEVIHTNPYPHIRSDHYRPHGSNSFDGIQPPYHRHNSSENSRALHQHTSRPRIRSMLDETYLPRIFSSTLPQLRPRLNEEDICPICRRALPPKGPGGDESAREAHIIECINARDPTHQAGSSRAPGSMPSPPRGPMHMLPFIATEKDCVGDDGNIPECSICMVEYDVGDELARLECLCKFHKECISEWFARKQECPVHKVS